MCGISIKPVVPPQTRLYPPDQQTTRCSCNNSSSLGELCRLDTKKWIGVSWVHLLLFLSGAQSAADWFTPGAAASTPPKKKINQFVLTQSQLEPQPAPWGRFVQNRIHGPLVRYHLCARSFPRVCRRGGFNQSEKKPNIYAALAPVMLPESETVWAAADGHPPQSSLTNHRRLSVRKPVARPGLPVDACRCSSGSSSAFKAAAPGVDFCAAAAYLLRPPFIQAGGGGAAAASWGGAAPRSTHTADTQQTHTNPPFSSASFTSAGALPHKPVQGGLSPEGAPKHNQLLAYLFE